MIDRLGHFLAGVEQGFGVLLPVGLRVGLEIPGKHLPQPDIQQLVDVPIVVIEGIMTDTALLDQCRYGDLKGMLTESLG